MTRGLPLLTCSALGLLALAACVVAPTIRSVPPPAAFAEPIDEVLATYPEAAPLFPEHTRAGRVGTARASTLLEAWGSPASQQSSLWNLWPGNWLYGTQSVWTWRLSGHRVECGVEKPLFGDATVGDCRLID